MSRTDAINRQMNKSDRGWAGKTYFNMDVIDELGVKLYRAVDGENFLAIIPPPDPEAYFAYEIYCHFQIGFNETNFLCPRMMAEKRCPLCEEYRRLKEAKSDNEELMRQLNPFPPRYLFWVADMTNAETQALGVQLYDAPMTVNAEILTLSKNPRTGELLDISDPVDGANLVFTKKGKGRGTKYMGFSLEARDPIPQEWLDAVVPFESTINIGTYDAMNEAFHGDEKEEEKPAAPTRRFPSRSVASDPADDDMDEVIPQKRVVRQQPTEVKEIIEDIGDELDTVVRRKRRSVVEEVPADDTVDEPDEVESDDPAEEAKRRLREKLRNRRANSDT